MSKSKFYDRTPEILSPSQHPDPLSINNKYLCVRCGEAEMRPKSRFCSDECLQGKKKPRIPHNLRQMVWIRDRGRCHNCGLDTVALAEQARTLFLQGGSYSTSRYASVFARKGYTRADKGKSLFVVLQKYQKKDLHVDNLMTICRPCERKIETRQQEFHRGKRKVDLSGQPGLFSHAEEDAAALRRPEGYSS